MRSTACLFRGCGNFVAESVFKSFNTSVCRLGKAMRSVVQPRVRHRKAMSNYAPTIAWNDGADGCKKRDNLLRLSLFFVTPERFI